MKPVATDKIIRYRGTDLNTKGWQQEAALRMLMNNLDQEVAEFQGMQFLQDGLINGNPHLLQ